MSTQAFTNVRPFIDINLLNAKAKKLGLFIAEASEHEKAKAEKLGLQVPLYQIQDDKRYLSTHRSLSWVAQELDALAAYDKRQSVKLPPVQ